jgi:hypothetical protein
MNNSVKFFIMGMVITLAMVFVFLAGLACTDKTPAQNANSGSGTPGNLEDFDNVVIASVGDKNFTLTDLLKSPQIYMIIHDQMIVPEIIQQEALSRGLVVDQQSIDQQVDQIYAQSGGMEQFLEANVPPSIPKELVPDDVRKTVMNRELQQLIIADRYEKEHGAATDAEITAKWEENSERYQRGYTDQNPGVDFSVVTLDQVRSLIEEDIKNQWINEHGASLVTDLEAEYTSRNYLLETIMASLAASQPEGSTIVVPPVEGATPPESETSGSETEGAAVGSIDDTGSGNGSTEPEPNPVPGSGQ